MSRRSPRIRCPKCRSLDTRKHDFLVHKRVSVHGKRERTFQRYWCKVCNKPFTPERSRVQQPKYDLTVNLEAARLYFDSRGSYRSVARELTHRCHTHIDGRRIFHLLNRLGENCRDPFEVSQELTPKWSPFLELDGKTIWIVGKEFVLLLAADAVSHDIIDARLVGSEDMLSWWKFLREIRDSLGYRPSAIVCDAKPGLLSAIKSVFPGIPYQVCVLHLYRFVKRFVPKGKRGRFALHNRLLRRMAYELLFADDLSRAIDAFKKLDSLREIFISQKHRMILRTLRRHFKAICTHFYHPGLPRDTNIVENIIRQLNRKLKGIGGFQKTDTAWNILKMAIMYYRFKEFTDSKTKERNGHSPLSLAGVNTQNINWLKFSQGLKLHH